jgi:hypothetical protein
MFKEFCNAEGRMSFTENYKEKDIMMEDSHLENSCRKLVAPGLDDDENELRGFMQHLIHVKPGVPIKKEKNFLEVVRGLP